MVKAKLIAQAKRFARHVPFQLVEAVAFPQESRWHRFGIERPGVDEPSVILFTLHKVASTFTNQLLGEINANCLNLKRMDWDKYVYNMVPSGTSEWIAARTDDLFAPSGYCYGVFRAPLPITSLGDYRVLLIVRDPRDILTSYYFSEAHSHAEPLDKARLQDFRARRAQVQEMTIDEYVLDKASDLERLLDNYMEMSSATGAQPLTYELMMSDWESFMDRVSDVLRVELDTQLRTKLRDLGQIGVEHGGDENQHRRKGTPGDHRHKLQPETIARLTEQFRRHLEWMSLPTEVIDLTVDHADAVVDVIESDQKAA